MKKFLDEFLEFSLKGNVLNLAVGVIIGAAFQGIVKSLTDNILSPALGVFTRQNFDSLQVEFFGAELKYGAFITSVINFLILAFVVFLIVKFINKVLRFGKGGTEAEAAAAEKEPEAAAPETRECPYCMTQVNAKATKCPACTSDI